MQIEVTDDLANRLRSMAEQQSISVPQLVERLLSNYLDSASEASNWVQVTQGLLGNVWPKEDFSDWQPPNAT